MLTRILVGAILCVGACAAAHAADAPLVLGDAAESVVVPETGGVEDVAPPDAAVVAEPGTSMLVDDPTPPDGSWPADSPAEAADSLLPPGWTAYTTFDALAMQRTNRGSRPLAITNQASTTPGVPVLTLGDVRYPTFFGLRAFQGWRGPDCTGFEVGYLGIWGMFADAQAVSATSELALPGELGLVEGSGFDAASAVRPMLNGTVNGVELNVFSTRIHECRQHDPLPWRRSWGIYEGSTSTADWLLGLRWVGLAESANLAVTANRSEPITTNYRVTTSSQLIGPQVGYRRRVEWSDWAFESWAKVGLMGSILSQSQGPVVGPFDLVEIRGPRSATAGAVGMIGDLNATVVRRFGDHWGLRAGYTLLWFSGVAPAADQWDFTNTPQSGKGLAQGNVFLHGATLGLEAGW